MIAKTINYVDYDGKNQKDTFYFNLNKAELLELEASELGGMSKLLQRIVDNSETTKLIPVFKQILGLSIGEKSLDGKYFEKTESIRQKFFQSEAYNVFFMELLDNAGAAATFFKGIMPEIDESNVLEMQNQ